MATTQLEQRQAAVVADQPAELLVLVEMVEQLSPCIDDIKT